jgi:hypothetical protein
VVLAEQLSVEVHVDGTEPLASTAGEQRSCLASRLDLRRFRTSGARGSPSPGASLLLEQAKRWRWVFRKARPSVRGRAWGLPQGKLRVGVV